MMNFVLSKLKSLFGNFSNQLLYSFLYILILQSIYKTRASTNQSMHYIHVIL